MDDTLALPMSADDAGTDASERLAVLFDLHHRRLWRLARRMVDDGEEARDLVQDTFLRAARRLASLPPAAEAAEGWLVRTLVNLCRDRQRRRRVRRERRGEALASPAARPGAAPDPEAAAVARATLERALSGLPPRRRAVLLLSELEPSQRLQLHLLSAGREPGEVPAALTAGPRQALEDLAAVLGYRRFDLLDSALVDTVQAARTNLAGPAGVVLDASLHVRTVTGLENEKIHVDLKLTVPGTDEQEPAAGGAPLRPGTLLSTSLSLNAGETVVVGTSRVDGGEEGLVLLLTALR